MDSAGGRARLTVNKAFFHPAAPGGAPVWITVTNVLFAVVIVGVLAAWWYLPVPFLVQAVFACLTRQGPYYLRYVWRALVRPILYLDT